MALPWWRWTTADGKTNVPLGQHSFDPGSSAPTLLPVEPWGRGAAELRGGGELEQCRTRLVTEELVEARAKQGLHLTETFSPDRNWRLLLKEAGTQLDNGGSTEQV